MLWSRNGTTRGGAVSDGRTAWRAYAAIAADLRDQITTGSLAPGMPVPSEATLSRTYGVVRNTVRRALAALEADGLIRTQPGRGRVVLDPAEPAPAAGERVPEYRRIATALRASIAAGELQPGDALPSEAALVTAYGVSRGTARQALADLEGAGLIESHHGKGRFVCQPS
jgi:DNA-binding GntR family transcriptional regulator